MNSQRVNNPRSSRRLHLEQLESRYLLTAFDVLVFSKTVAFRHSSITAGLAAVQSLGAANDFSVTATENANHFTAANLANYEAVVFLNTSGNVLNGTQQAAFEQYIQNGGGWAGTHSAADTEYNWSWYGDLMGAYFESHPPVRQATIVVEDQTHVSTSHLPQQWVRTDEWYNFQTNPREDVHVLATLDESTYAGGTQGSDHPIAWYHDFDGGRAWYTGLGHTSGTFSEQNFRDHLLGGILYAAGQVPQADSADFDGDGDTDGADFLQWQRGFGINSGADPSDGDANSDGKVNSTDLGVWQTDFGTTANLSAQLSTSDSAQPETVPPLLSLSPEVVDFKQYVLAGTVVDEVLKENALAAAIGTIAQPSEIDFEFDPGTNNGDKTNKTEATLDSAFAEFEDVVTAQLVSL